MGKHKKITQADRVMKYMRDFGSISSLDAFKDLGVTRLAAVVHTLRHKNGHVINMVTETSKNRYGDPVRYGRYSIVE